MDICKQYEVEGEPTGNVHSKVMTWLLWPGAVLGALACKTQQRRRYRARRRAFRGLLRLDDKMLWDIGVTREELLSVDALPLSISAADELNRISLTRRRKEKMGGMPR